MKSDKCASFFIYNNNCNVYVYFQKLFEFVSFFFKYMYKLHTVQHLYNT